MLRTLASLFSTLLLSIQGTKWFLSLVRATLQRVSFIQALLFTTVSLRYSFLGFKTRFKYMENGTQTKARKQNTKTSVVLEDCLKRVIQLEALWIRSSASQSGSTEILASFVWCLEKKTQTPKDPQKPNLSNTVKIDEEMKQCRSLSWWSDNKKTWQQYKLRKFLPGKLFRLEILKSHHIVKRIQFTLQNNIQILWSTTVFETRVSYISLTGWLIGQLMAKCCSGPIPKEKPEL